ncbi:MAG: BlaR1 peptidase family rane protein [Armatimonadetes bacterium]|nr:BlaR1 peptidase family rane protein [Armatimonadota bacterium]
MSLESFGITSALAFLGAGLLRATVCGGIALALAWIATRLPGLTTASARCWIWRLALLQLFVAFLWGRPVVEVPVLPAPTAPTAAVAIADEAPPTGSEPASTPAAATPAPPAAPGAGHLLAGLWLLATSIGLVALGLEWRRSLGVERRLVGIVDGPLVTRCGSLARVLGLPYVPYVGSAPEIETPTLLGMTRLTVALPPALLTTCSDADLELILAHELAHIRRKDLHWTWLPVLARTLFFFHPLVWVAQREYHLAQEGACDALAVECTGATVARYGDLLLRVSTGLGEPNGRLAAARMGESFSQLARRLEVIKHAFPVTPTRRGVSSLLVSATAIVGLTPWQLGARAALPAADGHVVRTAAPGALKDTVMAGPYEVRVSGIRRGGSSFNSSFSFGGGFSYGSDGVRRFEAPRTLQEFRPGVTLDLEIRSDDPNALARLAGIAPGARGMDNLGRGAISGPITPISLPLQHTPGLRKEQLELSLTPGASSFRSVDAALLMQSAEERVLSFPAAEIRPGAVRRAGNVTVTIDGVEVTDQGWQVGVTYEVPQPEGPASGGPLAHIQRRMLAGRNMSVTLHDSVGSAPAIGGKSRSTYNYTFGRIIGAQPETLEFRVLEHTGEPTRLPFRLENLRVPEPRQGGLLD